MNDHNHDEAPARRTTGQRLAGAGLLVVTVLTSLGHGASGNPFADYPPQNTCVAGSFRATPGGDLQTGYPGAPLGRPLTLRVTCRGSITGTEMSADYATQATWSASGGGQVNGETQTVSPAADGGIAQVHWSLGTGVGTQGVVATVEGRTYSFSATALPPTAGGGCTELVATTGTNFEPERRLVGSETWTLAGSPYRGKDVKVSGATLQIEAGVQVCLESLIVDVGQLVARGTPAAPVRLSRTTPAGLYLRLNGFNTAAAMELVHVQGDGISQLILGQTAVIEDSAFVAAPEARCRVVQLSHAGQPSTALPTQVRRTTFDGFGGGDPSCGDEAVLLATTNTRAGAPSVFSARVIRSTGVAVRVHPYADPWTLPQCELTGNGSHGLVADANAVTVSGCNISNNGGNGVHNPNPATYTVNARGNWWGDAAGPLGAAGDGISPGVDAAQPLAAPPVLGY